uniref:Uncharacterized protein n=1 Tax=Setaria viridis TaxID=4556 RepID=A0A4V6D6F1_SETVI|nr:hypothetical protein SEVIR_5G149750v2 [Setaria viridis]TKW14167.1 hypothetical protein SEVIR_5G149750v2 [Setaria viridis]
MTLLKYIKSFLIVLIFSPFTPPSSFPIARTRTGRAAAAAAAATRRRRLRHPLRRQAAEHTPRRIVRAEDRRLRDGEAHGEGFEPGADHSQGNRRVPRAGVDRRDGRHAQGRRVRLRDGAAGDRVREDELARGVRRRRRWRGRGRRRRCCLLPGPGRAKASGGGCDEPRGSKAARGRRRRGGGEGVQGGLLVHSGQRS